MIFGGENGELCNLGQAEKHATRLAIKNFKKINFNIFFVL